MRYSQNMEQSYILKYFGVKPGRFLDIGAFDGVNLSNTRALYERGWTGVLVEPSPTVFPRLSAAYFGVKGILCLNYAIGTACGTAHFWDNQNAVGTMKLSEVHRWKEWESFTPTEVEVKDWLTFYGEHGGNYDFISLDAEGMDYEILKQIPLDRVGCRMICVEHNGQIIEKCRDYIYGFDFKVIHINAENLIMAL